MVINIIKTNMRNTGLKRYLCLVLACFPIIFSCSTDELTIGTNFVGSQSYVTLIDTFAVEMSTILFDSLKTSDDTIILVGNYSDTLFGKITCNSAFEIGIPKSRDFEPTDIYDSICLILRFTGYYYGDTLTEHSFSVHPLSEDLEPYTDGCLYNTTTIGYNPEPLGSVSYIPKPLTNDSMYVLLDEDFGSELFNLYLDNGNFTTNSEFLLYLKGILLKPIDLNTNCILGFNASNAVIRIYYHRYEQYLNKLYVDLPLINTKEQYNQIITDFSASNYLSGITNTPTGLVSNSSGDMSFMQGATGLMQKIIFPSLNELLYINENGALLKAELVLVPEKTSYLNFSLPEVIIYKTDRYNNILGYVYNEYGYTVSGSLKNDEIYHENSSYTFDITKYINDQMDQKYINSNFGLLISLGSGNIASTLDRLVISSNTSSPKLKIYYVTYDE